MFDCVLETANVGARANERVQFSLRKYEHGKEGQRAEMGFVVMVIRTVGDRYVSSLFPSFHRISIQQTAT